MHIIYNFRYDKKCQASQLKEIKRKRNKGEVGNLPIDSDFC